MLSSETARGEVIAEIKRWLPPHMYNDIHSRDIANKIITVIEQDVARRLLSDEGIRGVFAGDPVLGPYEPTDGDIAATRRSMRVALDAIGITPWKGLVMSDVTAERARQDAKWGEQNHDDYRWLAILTEEVGELAQAILHDEFGGAHAGTVRDELVQVAAVAVQWIECIDRRGREDAT